MILNCIAIDDEPIALNHIASYITQTPFLNLVAKCTSAIDALKVIHTEADLQLIFLDIRMADLSGMELARILGASEKRKSVRIIFTTAYDQYALESYKVDALDYLLKPFNFVDFSRAANKAFEYFSTPGGVSTDTDIAVPAPGPIELKKEFIYLKVEYQVVKVDLDEILYVEGLKDYVKVYLAGEAKPLLSLSSLKNLEEKLPADRFMRLHRSFIVALNHIKAVTKSSVQIRDSTIYVSEQYKEKFARFLSTWV